MGVKICPQCSGKVSDARNDCPHCNYDFNSVKKCPDCEEQIDISLTECPICGHVFEAETKEEATETPKSEQKENTVQVEQTSQDKNVEGLFCPYCHSANAMPIGNDLYMCEVCKNKFLDTRGLPTPPLPIQRTANTAAPDRTAKEAVETTKTVDDMEDVEDVSEDVSQDKMVDVINVTEDDLTKKLCEYKKLLDSGLISEDEYNDLKDTLFRSLGVSKSSNSTVSVVFLWICSVFNFLGIFINMMISLGVWGDLHHMYTYILYGYIAGFSFISICTPAIIGLSIALKKKAKTNTSIKSAITGGIISIALTTFLMILSIFL